MRKLYIRAAILVLASGVAVQAADSGKVEVHGKRYEFVPAQITVKHGKPVTLHLISDDVAHSLRIRSLGVNTFMPVKQAVDVTFTPLEKGDYEGDCGKFCGSGHKDMKFVVHVE